MEKQKLWMLPPWCPLVSELKVYGIAACFYLGEFQSWGCMVLRDALALVSMGFGVENLQHYASFAGLFTCIFIMHVYLSVVRALSLPTALRHPYPKICIFEICSNFHAFIKICLFWRGGQ